MFSVVLFINRVYYFYIKLCTSEDYICKRETNFTIINNTEGYIKCKTMLAEHNFASLVLSIVFTFINTFCLVRLYKCYQNKLVVWKKFCVYTRDDPVILLSRCDSVLC